MRVYAVADRGDGIDVHTVAVGLKAEVRTLEQMLVCWRVHLPLLQGSEALG